MALVDDAGVQEAGVKLRARGAHTLDVEVVQRGEELLAPRGLGHAAARLETGGNGHPGRCYRSRLLTDIRVSRVGLVVGVEVRRTLRGESPRPRSHAVTLIGCLAAASLSLAVAAPAEAQLTGSTLASGTPWAIRLPPVTPTTSIPLAASLGAMPRRDCAI